MHDMRGLCVVDDTGALIMGLPTRLPARHLAPPAVLAEARDRDTRRLAMELLEVGRLEEAEPPTQALEAAKRLASKAGTLARLSEADLQVAALALHLKHAGVCARVIVATDDYALQYTLAKAGIEVLPIRYPGVSEARRPARRRKT